MIILQLLLVGGLPAVTVTAPFLSASPNILSCSQVRGAMARSVQVSQAMERRIALVVGQDADMA